MWGLVARSVAYGPLRDAGVRCAKVAPCQPGAGDEGVHALIVYVDNLYDKEETMRVLVSLLEDHGLEPGANKTDLYTLVGLDSNHPAKLRSTIWKPVDLIEGGKEGIAVSYKTGAVS